jgi:hypothetical protein
VSREWSGGESPGRIPWEGEGGIVSTTVVHVEWTEEELLRNKYGGLGREGFAGIISTGRVIVHQRAIGRGPLIIKTTRAVREERLHAGGEGRPDGRREGTVI